MENLDYSLVRKYLSRVPIIKSFLRAATNRTKYPLKINLGGERENKIKSICVNKEFNLSDNKLISAIYWVTLTIDPQKEIEEFFKPNKIGQEEANRQKLALFDYFNKHGEKVFKGTSLTIKAKGKGLSIRIDDQYLAGFYVNKIREEILKDDQFREDNIQDERATLFPGKGNQRSKLNWYRTVWLSSLFDLFNENTKLSKEKIYLLIAHIFYISGHFFKGRENTIKNVSDESFFPDDITKQLRSLHKGRTNKTPKILL